MVMQTKMPKSSSRKTSKRGVCEFRSIVQTDRQLPSDLELITSQLDVDGCIAGYSILGRLADQDMKPAKWKTPPHRDFANLPLAPASTFDKDGTLIDPQAMLSFVKRYGFLRKKCSEGWYSQREQRFIQPTSELMEYAKSDSSVISNLVESNPHGFLRYAWRSNDKVALEELRKQAASGMTANISADSGEIIVTTKDVWSLVCLLFWRDYSLGKTAICANPDCPAPYFLRKRKTQKICEAGDCVSWAQRKYALKWWHENQAKKSTKKMRREDSDDL